MTSITIGQLASVDVEYTIKNRDKHTAHRLFLKELVCVGYASSGRLSSKSRSSKQCAAYSHENSCRDSLAADIGHNQADTVVVNTEKIVKIATYVFGSFHRCSQLNFVYNLWKWWENAWEDSLLDFPGNGQVAFQRL